MPPEVMPPGVVVEAVDVVEEAVDICFMVYNTRT
jgi:hypothetical protein